MRFTKVHLCTLSLILVAVLSAGVLAQNAERPLPWTVTNAKAVNAASGDPIAVSALVEDVLSGSEILEAVSATDPSLKQNIISAQISYNNNRHKGVQEIKVVQALNALVKKLGAPEFAYTNKFEVRRARMRLLPVVPALFLRDLKRTDKDGKSHIREEMSPVEAVYLFARLVDQKLWNPDYQLTAREQRQKWAQLHSAPTTPSSEPSDRTKKLLDVVSGTSTTTSLRDMASSASEMISTLVSAQQGGN